MKTLKEYSTLIEKNKDNPSFLSVLNTEISADYGFCSSRMMHLKLERAIMWPAIKMEKEKPLSDSLTDSFYQQTEVGKEETKLKYKMKALEVYMAAIKAQLFVSNQEAHNQY